MANTIECGPAMHGGMLGFIKRQYLRYQVISGTYMLTWPERLALHTLIFGVFILFLRYASKFIIQFIVVKDELL